QRAGETTRGGRAGATAQGSGVAWQFGATRRPTWRRRYHRARSARGGDDPRWASRRDSKGIGCCSAVRSDEAEVAPRPARGMGSRGGRMIIVVCIIVGAILGALVGDFQGLPWGAVAGAVVGVMLFGGRKGKKDPDLDAKIEHIYRSLADI